MYGAIPMISEAKRAERAERGGGGGGNRGKGAKEVGKRGGQMHEIEVELPNYIESEGI